MSKILLTGGSGFIGSHVHDVIPNDQIINLDQNHPSFPAASTFVKGDIRQYQDVTNAVRGNQISTIFSLAAKHHDFGIGHDEYFDTNEDGMKVLCKVASENNIREFIFYSSVAVYGLQGELMTESTSPRPDGPYGASKLAGEKILYQWAQEDPARKVLIIRPTIVFGPRNKANMFNLIKQIDSGLYFHVGKADNVKSIAYVENLVQATLYLKERMKPGVSIFNYADEPQLTSREISDHIASVLQKKIWLTLPKPFAILLGLPFDVIIKVTGKNLPISTARIKKLGTQTKYSAKKIWDTGFIPRFTTRDGIARMIEWYKNHF